MHKDNESDFRLWNIETRSNTRFKGYANINKKNFVSFPSSNSVLKLRNGLHDISLKQRRNILNSEKQNDIINITTITKLLLDILNEDGNVLEKAVNTLYILSNGICLFILLNSVFILIYRT